MAAQRILFFADASSVHTRRWVQAMAERGFECLVATRRPGELPGAADVLPLHPGSDGAGWFLALPAVRRLARRVRPQWLHGHYVTSYGLWAASARAVVDAPLVQTAWGSDILVTPRAPGWRGRAMAALVRRSLARAALVTADSQDMLDEIRRLLRGVAPAPRCEQVLWGADTDRFVPADPAPGFEIASLRAWEPNYRIDVLLHAFARFAAARPQAGAVLHLLGGGPDAPQLQALAAQLGVAAQVHFTGRVDIAAMVATLQRCRVSVSVPASDATSVSVLESMACGLPVVASDLPANRQWLDARLLVPAGDASALAEVLLRLHDDPPGARTFGRANRDRALREASRSAQMDHMAALLHTLRPGAA